MIELNDVEVWEFQTSAGSTLPVGVDGEGWRHHPLLHHHQTFRYVCGMAASEPTAGQPSNIVARNNTHGLWVNAAGRPSHGIQFDVDSRCNVLLLLIGEKCGSTNTLI